MTSVELTVAAGPQEGRVIRVDDPRSLVIGRAEDAEVRIACDEHPGASDAPVAGRLGDYELRGVLGEGAMGVVHLAYHAPTARLWAAKVIRNLTVGALVTCGVEVACTAGRAGECHIEALCRGPRRVTVDVRLRGRPRSRCRAVLVEVHAGGAASGPAAQAAHAGAARARRLSQVAKERLDANGELVLRLRLNKVGRRLLGDRPIGGQLPAEAEVTIREPKQDGGQLQLLPRLLTLVRGR